MIMARVANTPNPRLQRRSSFFCTANKFKKICDSASPKNNADEFMHICPDDKCHINVFFTSIERCTKGMKGMCNNDTNVLIFNKKSYSTPRHKENINGAITIRFCTQCGTKLRQQRISKPSALSISPSHSTSSHSMSFDTETSCASSLKL